MTNQEFWKKNLEFNTSLVEKMEPFSDRKVSELPDNIKVDLQRIKVGPRITTSGLESVYSLLEELNLINSLLKQAIRDPEGFMKMYGRKKPTTINKQPTIPVAEPAGSLRGKADNHQPSTNDKETKEPKNKETENKPIPKITIMPKQPITPLRQGLAGQANNEIPPPASKIEL